MISDVQQREIKRSKMDRNVEASSLRIIYNNTFLIFVRTKNDIWKKELKFNTIPQNESLQNV